MTQQKKYKDVFCYRLKQARTAKGLSQRKLGILAGIDEFVASTRINRYEKGIHEANIETVYRLAMALEVPLAFFYTEDNYLAEIIIGFEKLPTNTKHTIYTMISNKLSND